MERIRKKITFALFDNFLNAIRNSGQWEENSSEQFVIKIRREQK